MARTGTIRRRHLRHGRFSRVRRGKDFLAWLTDAQGVLDGTGTGKTVTLSGAQLSAAVITVAVNPTDGDTFILGAKTYRFKDTTAQANDIKIGASASATIDNAVAAIAASGTGDGTDYHTGTTANASATASAGTGTIDVTALTPGVAGDLIPISVDFTDETNVLDVTGGYLEGGHDYYVFNNTSHGYAVGDGPFVLTAATTLPDNYTAGTQVWVRTVPTANTFTVTTVRGSDVAVEMADDGTGTLTLTKLDTEEAIFNLLRTTKPVTIDAADDVDDL